MLAERVAGASSSILVSRMNPRDLLGCRMEDQRRIVDDTRQLADMLDEFREQELRRVLCPNLPEAILDPFTRRLPHLGEEAIDVYGVLPDVEGSHGGVVDRALATAPRRYPRAKSNLEIGLRFKRWERSAQRGARDLHEARKRLAHFQDQEERRGRR